MKLKSILPLVALVGSAFVTSLGYAQSIPTLEMDVDDLPATSGFGSGLTPMTSVLRNDVLNNSVFAPNSPEINVTVSLRNQQFSNLNYGSTTAIPIPGGGFYSNFQTTGLVFGVGPLTAQDGTTVATGGFPLNRYDFTGAYYVGGTGGPKDNMFTTNPKATGTELGTGMRVLQEGPGTNVNGSFQIFTTAQALFGSANGIGSRVYFGDIVFRFNTPVTNPVLHFSGLGGAYRYCPPTGNVNNAADYLSTFFSTELELVNTGLTSVKMSGNPLFNVTGNNVLNANNANPNGGSFDAGLENGLFNNYGAATGSVKLIGTVQEVVYRVYLEGGTASQFAWSVPGSSVISNNRDPFTGDIWYAAVSLDKPTQQISGNVFLDKDGLVDNNVNASTGAANPKTNAGGLFANLLNAGGMVVASVPVTPEGVFLFDEVPVGNYQVQLTTIAGTGTYTSPSAAPLTQLPAGWANTGEFVGATVGSDGLVNGRSSSVTVQSTDIKTQVNFGIQRLPESVDFATTVPQPVVGTVFTLSPVNTPGLPILSGSDPEDMPTVGVLTNKTIQITTLPTNTTLRYNGVPVTAGQVITNYNPALLTILVTSATAGATETSFRYAYVDAAGKPDPTPALYTIQWVGILPVTLLSFDANAVDCSAKISWVTSSEVNTKEFDLEVSSDNGSSFGKTATVNAAGTSNSGKSYASAYPMQAGVTYYFRLKIINTDGSFSYTDIRKASCVSGNVKISLAPNPVATSFMLRGMDNGKNQVFVYSSNGQLMKTQTIVNTQGSVDVSNFAGGTYNVRIVSQSGNISTIQMIKN